MESIGILESNSIAKGIEAADAILKAAEVTLLFAKPVCPGKYTVLFYGEVAAVRESVAAGMAEGKEKGIAVTSVVIPSPTPELFDALK